MRFEQKFEAPQPSEDTARTDLNGMAIERFPLMVTPEKPENHVEIRISKYALTLRNWKKTG